MNFSGFPTDYKILGGFEDVPEQDYSVTYQLNSDWGSGFTGTIVIANRTDKVLEDWYMEFIFDRNITNIWNGLMERQEGNLYVIHGIYM